MNILYYKVFATAKDYKISSAYFSAENDFSITDSDIGKKCSVEMKLLKRQNYFAYFGKGDDHKSSAIYLFININNILTDDLIDSIDKSIGYGIFELNRYELIIRKGVVSIDIVHRLQDLQQSLNRDIVIDDLLN